MKAITTEFLYIILAFIVGLAISFWLIYSYLYKPVTLGVLGLPDGAWYYIEGVNIKSFIPPPSIWFGNSLTLNGKTIDYSNIYPSPSQGDSVKLIFPESIFVDKVDPFLDLPGIPKPEDYYLIILIYSLVNPSKLNSLMVSNTYTFKFKVNKPSHPNVAFYPLITDNFGDLVDTTNNPAEHDTSLDLYYLAHPENLNSNFILKFKIDLDKIKEYYENRGYYFDENTDSIKFTFLKETKTLEDYIGDGTCKSDGTFNCFFSYPVFEKNCCPSYFELNNLTIEFKLTKEGVELWRREKLKPIRFTIVYYFDKISDKDLIFENFDNVITLLKEAGNEINDINIYPCRAKISLRKKDNLTIIKDVDGSAIDWESCDSNYKQLNKKDTTKKSTWYCKESGDYLYLYNPYGYCSLEYDIIENKIKLPEIPKIVYLHSFIPSGKIEVEPEVDFVLDTPFGIKNQAASILAAYTIYNFHDVFSGSGAGGTLFSDISTDGITIKFNFTS
jgi:hypothetical protein